MKGEGLGARGGDFPSKTLSGVPQGTLVTRGTFVNERWLFLVGTSPQSNAKTYVTSGCHCLEKSVSVQIVYGAKPVRKLCWKCSDKTKYKAIKSEVNKQELFYRYSTFKASLSRNCFIF